MPTKKRCSGCLEYMPATTEFFHADPCAASGLHSRCRSCRYLTKSKRPTTRKVQVDREYVPGKKPCTECHDLPWRVLGERQGNICDECGLEYAEEAPPEMRLRRFDRVG